MKSKFFTILLVLSAIMPFSACTNEEGVVDNSTDLRISTSIESRAVITSTSFSKGDNIGISLPEQTKKFNILAPYNENGWELSERIPLSVKEEPVYAYYPYNGDYTDLQVPVWIDGTTDYLYGKSQGDVNMSNPEAHLVFKHALARITFSIKLSNENSSSKTLSEIILKNVGEITAISNWGMMDITTGEIKEKTVGNVHYKLEDKSISSNNLLNIDMLVIPTIIETGNQVEAVFFINGKQYVIPMPTATWEAGQQYTYPITINISDEDSEENTSSALAKVGDYYYSDGTWSSEYDESKTCIGIVFALSEEQDGGINASLKESMHGRIVALQDLDKKYAWGSNGIDVEGIANYRVPAGFNGDYIMNYLPTDGESTYYGGNHAGILPYNYETWPTEKGRDYALTDYNGKRHTSYIKESEFPAGHACYHKTKGEITTGFWYLPSCGEMGRLAMACAIGIISSTKQYVFNNLISGDNDNIEYYWTSTEVSESTAFAYNVYSGNIYDDSFFPSKFKFTKETEMNVRPIASF